MRVFPDDIELVARLQKGDIEAFDLIYEKYSGKLYTFALKYLRSVSEAEDLVQSVFLKLWENHKNLNKELSFKSFLFVIAYNDICKLFRKRSYYRKYLEDSLYTGPQSSNEIENNLHLSYFLEYIQRIVDKLPERQKSIFIKSWKEGKSTKAISEELGLASGTIDNYISESLKFIRTRLKNGNSLVMLFLSFFL